MDVSLGTAARDSPPSLLFFFLNLFFVCGSFAMASEDLLRGLSEEEKDAVALFISSRRSAGAVGTHLAAGSAGGVDSGAGAASTGRVSADDRGAHRVGGGLGAEAQNEQRDEHVESFSADCETYFEPAPPDGGQQFDSTDQPQPFGQSPHSGDDVGLSHEQLHADADFDVHHEPEVRIDVDGGVNQVETRADDDTPAHGALANYFGAALFGRQSESGEPASGGTRARSLSPVPSPRSTGAAGATSLASQGGGGIAPTENTSWFPTVGDASALGHLGEEHVVSDGGVMNGDSSGRDSALPVHEATGAPNRVLGSDEAVSAGIAPDLVPLTAAVSKFVSAEFRTSVDGMERAFAEALDVVGRRIDDLDNKVDDVANQVRDASSRSFEVLSVLNELDVAIDAEVSKKFATVQRELDSRYDELNSARSSDMVRFSKQCVDYVKNSLRGLDRRVVALESGHRTQVVQNERTSAVEPQDRRPDTPTFVFASSTRKTGDVADDVSVLSGESGGGSAGSNGSDDADKTASNKRKGRPHRTSVVRDALGPNMLEQVLSAAIADTSADSTRVQVEIVTNDEQLHAVADRLASNSSGFAKVRDSGSPQSLGAFLSELMVKAVDHGATTVAGKAATSTARKGNVSAKFQPAIASTVARDRDTVSNGVLGLASLELLEKDLREALGHPTLDLRSLLCSNAIENVVFHDRVSGHISRFEYDHNAAQDRRFVSTDVPPGGGGLRLAAVRNAIAKHGSAAGVTVDRSADDKALVKNGAQIQKAMVGAEMVSADSIAAVQHMLARLWSRLQLLMSELEGKSECSSTKLHQACLYRDQLVRHADIDVLGIQSYGVLLLPTWCYAWGLEPRGLLLLHKLVMTSEMVDGKEIQRVTSNTIGLFRELTFQNGIGATLLIQQIEGVRSQVEDGLPDAIPESHQVQWLVFTLYNNFSTVRVEKLREALESLHSTVMEHMNSSTGLVEDNAAVRATLTYDRLLTAVRSVAHLIPASRSLSNIKPIPVLVRPVGTEKDASGGAAEEKAEPKGGRNSNDAADKKSNGGQRSTRRTTPSLTSEQQAKFSRFVSDKTNGSRVYMARATRTDFNKLDVSEIFTKDYGTQDGLVAPIGPGMSPASALAAALENFNSDEFRANSGLGNIAPESFVDNPDIGARHVRPSSLREMFTDVKFSEPFVAIVKFLGRAGALGGFSTGRAQVRDFKSYADFCEFLDKKKKEYDEARAAKIFCNLCGKKGHFARDCPTKRDESKSAHAGFAGSGEGMSFAAVVKRLNSTSDDACGEGDEAAAEDTEERNDFDASRCQPFLQHGRAGFMAVAEVLSEPGSMPVVFELPDFLEMYREDIELVLSGTGLARVDYAAIARQLVSDITQVCSDSFDGVFDGYRDRPWEAPLLVRWVTGRLADAFAAVGDVASASDDDKRVFAALVMAAVCSCVGEDCEAGVCARRMSCAHLSHERWFDGCEVPQRIADIAVVSNRATMRSTCVDAAVGGRVVPVDLRALGVGSQGGGGAASVSVVLGTDATMRLIGLVPRCSDRSRRVVEVFGEVHRGFEAPVVLMLFTPSAAASVGLVSERLPAIRLHSLACGRRLRVGQVGDDVAVISLDAAVVDEVVAARGLRLEHTLGGPSVGGSPSWVLDELACDLSLFARAARSVVAGRSAPRFAVAWSDAVCSLVRELCEPVISSGALGGCADGARTAAAAMVGDAAEDDDTRQALGARKLKLEQDDALARQANDYASVVANQDQGHRIVGATAMNAVAQLDMDDADLIDDGDAQLHDIAIDVGNGPFSAGMSGCLSSTDTGGNGDGVAALADVGRAAMDIARSVRESDRSDGQYGRDVGLTEKCDSPLAVNILATIDMMRDRGYISDRRYKKWCKSEMKRLRRLSRKPLLLMDYCPDKDELLEPPELPIDDDVKIVERLLREGTYGFGDEALEDAAAAVGDGTQALVLVSNDDQDPRGHESLSDSDIAVMMAALESCKYSAIECKYSALEDLGDTLPGSTCTGGRVALGELSNDDLELLDAFSGPERVDMRLCGQVEEPVDSLDGADEDNRGNEAAGRLAATEASYGDADCATWWCFLSALVLFGRKFKSAVLLTIVLLVAMLIHPSAIDSLSRAGGAALGDVSSLPLNARVPPAAGDWWEHSPHALHSHSAASSESAAAARRVPLRAQVVAVRCNLLEIAARSGTSSMEFVHSYGRRACTWFQSHVVETITGLFPTRDEPRRIDLRRADMIQASLQERIDEALWTLNSHGHAQASPGFARAVASLRCAALRIRNGARRTRTTEVIGNVSDFNVPPRWEYDESCDPTDHIWNYASAGGVDNITVALNNVFELATRSWESNNTGSDDEVVCICDSSDHLWSCASTDVGDGVALALNNVFELATRSWEDDTPDVWCGRDVDVSTDVGISNVLNGCYELSLRSAMMSEAVEAESGLPAATRPSPHDTGWGCASSLDAVGRFLNGVYELFSGVTDMSIVAPPRFSIAYTKADGSFSRKFTRPDHVANMRAHRSLTRSLRRATRGPGRRRLHAQSVAMVGATGVAFKSLVKVAEASGSHFMLYDTGANVSLCSDRGRMRNLRASSSPLTVTGIDGVPNSLEECGDVSGYVDTLRGPRKVELTGFYHLPGVPVDLLAGSTCHDMGISAVLDIDDPRLVLRDGTGVPLIYHNGLYVLELTQSAGALRCGELGADSVSTATACSATLQTWHDRLGHVSPERLLENVDKGAVTGIKILGSRKTDNIHSCTGCRFGGSQRARIPSSSTRVTNASELMPFSRVVTDVKGPLTPALDGSRYLVTFTCVATRYSIVAGIKSKDEVALVARRLLLWTRRNGMRVQSMYSDGGGEYQSLRGAEEIDAATAIYGSRCALDLADDAGFQTLLLDNDIKYDKTPPYTPELNGIAERKNGTLFRMANSMLMHANLSTVAWLDAVQTANYIQNRTMTAGLPGDITPFEAVFRVVPDLSSARVFGCDVFVHDHKSSSLGPRSWKGINLGPNLDGRHGWRILNPLTRTISVEFHVHFVEDLSSRRGMLMEYDIRRDRYDAARTAGDGSLNAPGGMLNQRWEPASYDDVTRADALRSLFDLGVGPVDTGGELISRARSELDILGEASASGTSAASSGEPSSGAAETDLVGRRVSKLFGRHGWYEGTVVAVEDDVVDDDGVTPCPFRILYDDETSEHVTLNELMTIIKPTPAARSSDVDSGVQMDAPSVGPSQSPGLGDGGSGCGTTSATGNGGSPSSSGDDGAHGDGGSSSRSGGAVLGAEDGDTAVFGSAGGENVIDDANHDGDDEWAPPETGPLSTTHLDGLTQRGLAEANGQVRPFRAKAAGNKVKRTAADKLWINTAKDNDYIIRFDQTYVKGPKSNDRYKKYNSATTIAAARNSGASSADINYDYEMGLITFPGRESRQPGHFCAAAAAAYYGGVSSAYSMLSVDDLPTFHEGMANWFPHEVLDDWVGEPQKEIAFANESIYNVFLCTADGEIPSNALDYGTPNMYSDAKSNPMWPIWNKACDKEFDGLNDIPSWEWVPKSEASKDPRFSEKNVMPCRWVFRWKCDSAGKVYKAKARIVVRGDMSKPGIHYKDVFAPTCSYDAMRTMCSIAAAEGLQMWQADVAQAFCQASIDDNHPVWIRPPQGYERYRELPGGGREPYLLRLTRSVYGLKNAPAEWYKLFASVLIDDLGFTKLTSDSCIFMRSDDSFETDVGHEGEPAKIFMSIYVDDVLLCTNSSALYRSVLDKLSKRFPINENETGEASWLVGMKIERNMDEGWLTLSQEAAILKLADACGLRDSNPKDTPMSTEPLPKLQKPSVDAEKCINGLSFRSVLGSVLYFSMVTRPDVSFAVNSLARHAATPGQQHVNALKRVVTYLYHTASKGLTYYKSRDPAENNVPLFFERGTHPSDAYDMSLSSYADSDYAQSYNRRSTSGFVLMLNGAPISWGSRMQRVCAQSTAEAEIIAAADCVKEVIHTRLLLKELGYGKAVIEPTVVYEDNVAARLMATGQKSHRTAKHFETRLRFLQDHTSNGTELQFTQIPTADQLADVFTKPLPRDLFNKFAEKLVSVPPVIRGALGGSVEKAVS